MELSNLKVAILYGGWSDETDYTAHNEVEEAIKSYNLDYIMITINDTEWIQKLNDYNPDVAFITNQGTYGEDGRIQAVLDILDIKYIGSGVLASSIGMNKYFFKRFISQLGIKTPKYILHKYGERKQKFLEVVDYLSLPFIVKPVSNGASVGVVLIENENNYLEQIELLENRYGDLLLEEYIGHPKKELGVGILEINNYPTVIPGCLIEYKSEFFSNTVKCSGIDVKECFITDCDISNKASDITLKIHMELGCSGLSRVDFVIDSNEELYVLEINTLPGLLNNSLFPKACKAGEISYREMIKELILSAYNRKPFDTAKVSQKINI